jgi:hypothetical protein
MRLRQLFLTAVFLFGFAAVASADSTAPVPADTTSAQGVPILEIPDSSFNFGIAPQQSKISHVFWLHNRGDGTLIIRGVTPG